MLNVACQFLGEAPWRALWPGLAIIAVLIGFNLLGDGLNDAMSPRDRRLARLEDGQGT
jgi:peptide/nickel transport system permease protein